jgi:PBP1b-binding outer membrane lipoprotein LpoB
MKKKMNYLILLLTTIFIMLGCTNEEDASNTDVETDSQEVTTVETNKNSEKEETVTTVVDEPVVEETPSVPVAEETPTQSNNELF